MLYVICLRIRNDQLSQPRQAPERRSPADSDYQFRRVLRIRLLT